MDLLQLRENEIFKTLKMLKGLSFVLIGGYAVNAYALPRFSVDCDIVIKDRANLDKFAKIFVGLGYVKAKAAKPENSVDFARYEKTLAESFKVGFDVLIGEVFDRQTKVSIQAEWIFKNSEISMLKGKTISEELKLSIINIDALFVMKMISCRSTDIRDIFMLAQSVKNREWIKQEITSRYDFNKLFEKVKAKITSKDFKDGLQGVYGLLDYKIFEKSVNAFLALNN